MPGTDISAFVTLESSLSLPSDFSKLASVTLFSADSPLQMSGSDLSRVSDFSKLASAVIPFPSVSVFSADSSALISASGFSTDSDSTLGSVFLSISFSITDSSLLISTAESLTNDASSSTCVSLSSGTCSSDSAESAILFIWSPLNSKVPDCSFTSLQSQTTFSVPLLLSSSPSEPWDTIPCTSFSLFSKLKFPE